MPHLGDHLLQTLPKTGPARAPAQDHVQMGIQSLKGWIFHIFSEYPLPEDKHHYSRKLQKKKYSCMQCSATNATSLCFSTFWDD